MSKIEVRRRKGLSDYTIAVTGFLSETCYDVNSIFKVFLKLLEKTMHILYYVHWISIPYLHIYCPRLNQSVCCLVVLIKVRTSIKLSRLSMLAE